MAKRKNKQPKAEEPQKLGRKEFDAELYKLHAELCNLQDWAKHSGHRVVVIFEGRDAAGKGGVIKRITERVSPRVFRVVALPAPTEREKSQLYIQRYVAHLPAAGEIVLFDRSWYNRAGVERVMGFCTEEQSRDFLRVCPASSASWCDSGIQLIKYFFDVSQDEQERRFRDRIEDPRKQWKLSPMDLESDRRWWSTPRLQGDDRGDRHRVRAVVQGGGRRQAARPAELHRPHVKPDPLRTRGGTRPRSRQARKPKGNTGEPLFAHTVPERF